MTYLGALLTKITCNEITINRLHEYRQFILITKGLIYIKNNAQHMLVPREKEEMEILKIKQERKKRKSSSYLECCKESCM